MLLSHICWNCCMPCNLCVQSFADNVLHRSLMDSWVDSFFPLLLPEVLLILPRFPELGAPSLAELSLALPPDVALLFGRLLLARADALSIGGSPRPCNRKHWTQLTIHISLDTTNYTNINFITLYEIWNDFLNAMILMCYSCSVELIGIFETKYNIWIELNYTTT